MYIALFNVFSVYGPSPLESRYASQEVPSQTLVVTYSTIPSTEGYC